MANSALASCFALPPASLQSYCVIYNNRTEPWMVEVERRISPWMDVIRVMQGAITEDAKAENDYG